MERVKVRLAGAGSVMAWLWASQLLWSGEAYLLVKGKWNKTPARTVAQVKGFSPRGPVRLSQYGGWAERKVRPTGFFHARKIGGRWWLIDPEGCLFLSVGLCSVNTGTLDQTAWKQRYGSPGKWGEDAAAMLKFYGFNSLGCWSDWQVIRPTKHKMPYFPRWNFMSTYKNRRDPKYGPRGYPKQCMPVFDPDWPTFCDEHAKQLAATKDDPWLVGHFSDNELPFRPDLLEYYLKLPETDPGHRVARAWWDARRGRSKRRMTARDKAAFLELVVGRYYTTVARAIRKYDPNHLYVGSRVHGRTICEPVFRGAKAVDVVSVNYYHRWSAEIGRVRNWAKWSTRPVLVSEWYAQSVASARTKASGAGFRVKTDRGRGLFYQNMALGLLESGVCVGWHWFKYGGDGDGYHKGVVSRTCQPHTELLDRMGELNRRVYPLAKHLRR